MHKGYHYCYLSTYAQKKGWIWYFLENKCMKTLLWYFHGNKCIITLYINDRETVSGSWKITMWKEHICKSIETIVYYMYEDITIVLYILKRKMDL